ncbi:MAG: orotidine-5'-phosphate decarboxylase [bacterium]|nr:orotidine-5'-phosphate decarboxylase [bacterium]
MRYAPRAPWLDPAEQAEVCQKLLQYELMEFSNKRDLPLKKGGTTDIYINERNARNYPEAIDYLAKIYRNPLLRLGIDRFVEVPDSVSCFAGSLAQLTGIPYLTIREQAKVGRVAKAKVIGNPRRGEKVAVIDDVITDGASKVEPFRECERMMLDIKALVVLVDRQQGWQRNFADNGITLPVWAGMTLHDVRKQLISVLGVMERCDKALEEKNPLIVALDGKSWDEILSVIDRLRPTGCILKVNDLLFEKGIENLIPDLSVYGRVMADLKSHDIESTVANIAARLKKNPPWAVTVHASGGEKMIRAAVEMLKGTQTKVLAVTVLTSFDKATCEEIYSRLPLDEVKALAAIAHRAGAHGLVCSPEEVKILRALYPNITLVTPGIRSAGVSANDQVRIATPAAARQNGADYLVMGRQILKDAPDPVAEVHRLLTEELFIV